MTNKAKTISQEEIEYLAALKAKRDASKSAMPQMKQLAINMAQVDENGKDIQGSSWHIRGENTYSRTVTFRPTQLVNKYIKMSKQGATWRTDNESIFVEGFEPAYDTKGTTACGRLVGRVPDSWTEVQKTENWKKSTSYAFLFGLVTFDGKEPELVNFRAAPAKAKVIREALKSLGGDNDYLYYTFTMKLIPDKQAGGQPSMEMTTDAKHKHTTFGELMPFIKESEKYIADHNAQIMIRRKNFEAQVGAGSSFKEIETLAGDFDDELPINLKGINH